jgi:hypothetical protein
LFFLSVIEGSVVLSESIALYFSSNSGVSSPLLTNSISFIFKGLKASSFRKEFVMLAMMLYFSSLGQSL